MTDYHVRPVNGDDSNGGTGPDNAWKSFFGPASGGQGGTYNCAQVTDGDRVFLWAEGVTAGEFLSGYNFDWYWPLENGNVCFIGLNENGEEDGTRYVIYMNEGWGGFNINASGASNFSAYYPELTTTYEGNERYIMLLKNIRITETNTLDPTKGGSNTIFSIGGYMANSRPIMYNCEMGPFTGTAPSLPRHSRYGGDITLINCYFHDDNSTYEIPMPDPTIVGCVFDNIGSVVDWEMYGSGTITNNVFMNHTGSMVIKLDEASGNETAFNVISNNVFYNNNGTCIRTFDDQSLSKVFIYNNIFDSNGSVIDLNSVTHTYSSAGGARNVLLNNTNNIVNSGSDTIDDFFTIGFGAGGSGGIGTTFDTNNYYSGSVDYLSTSGTGDFRVKTSSTLDQLGYLKETVGLGLSPFTTTDTGDLSLGTGGVGDSITVSSRTYQKVQDGPIVWRRTKPSVILSYNPRNISSLQAWWDANEYQNITMSDSYGGVATWTDQLGTSVLSGDNDNYADNVEYSAARRLNGKPYIYIKPNNDDAARLSDGNPTFGTTDLYCDSGEQFTVMIVASAYSGQSSVVSGLDEIGTLIGKGGGWGGGGTYLLGRTFKDSSGNPYNNWVISLRGYPDASSVESIENHTPATDGFHILGSQWDGSSHEFRINGVTQSNMSYVGTSSNQNDLFNIGTDDQSNSYYNGGVCEIMVFDSSLSDSDRQAIEGYLAHKWGLQSNLSVDHPYKLTPPT